MTADYCISIVIDSVRGNAATARILDTNEQIEVVDRDGSFLAPRALGGRGFATYDNGEWQIVGLRCGDVVRLKHPN